MMLELSFADGGAVRTTALVPALSKLASTLSLKPAALPAVAMTIDTATATRTVARKDGTQRARELLNGFMQQT
ncbi:protoporphyrinogen oxidase [Leifsonia xyli subsp. cynodontis DSM 46306]|uniref:Uncharacterized protein n=1 Tax=Leifsonia xyli subsp. cynodontis DSM 46306 TaxID=1389489 RepID=U3PCG3_LEIXC|nr:protoporphyrinogen oxidase [Leifsonia xyli subsp. cynodontis DSM 46306]